MSCCLAKASFQKGQQICKVQLSTFGKKHVQNLCFNSINLTSLSKKRQQEMYKQNYHKSIQVSSKKKGNTTFCCFFYRLEASWILSRWSTYPSLAVLYLVIRISHLKCDVCILVYPGNNLWSVTTLTLTHIDANQPLCRQFLRPDTSEGMSSNWSALSGPQGFVRVHSESSHIQKQCLKWVASRPSNKEYCQKKNARLLLRLYMSTKNCQIRPPSSKCLLLPKVDTSSRAALAGASIPLCFVVFYPHCIKEWPLLNMKILSTEIY